jgi:hypothetical protein
LEGPIITPRGGLEEGHVAVGIVERRVGGGRGAKLIEVVVRVCGDDRIAGMGLGRYQTVIGGIVEPLGGGEYTGDANGGGRQAAVFVAKYQRPVPYKPLCHLPHGQIHKFRMSICPCPANFAQCSSVIACG